MIRTGVIGYGYWGPNLVRNFAVSREAILVMVSDLDPKRLDAVHHLYPSVKTTSNPKELITSPDVDAIAIATPVSTHFDLAMEAMRAGKHVMVEKPMAETSGKCQLMIEEAEKRGLTLMVDHTFPYTGAVRKIKSLIEDGELGNIYYYDSVRVNLGLFQHDVSVIWDLAVHDLSIVDYILPQKPVAVSATGISHVEGQPADMAYLTLFFEDSTLAHFHVNWLAPVKLRQTLIGGSKKMIVYNDLEANEKVKIYDRGITLETNADNIYKMRVGYRAFGDMLAPQIDRTEALQLITSHFVECIEAKKSPVTSAQSGLRVVKIMEAATQSMANRGDVIQFA